jgi:hypothetical protein
MGAGRAAALVARTRGDERRRAGDARRGRAGLDVAVAAAGWSIPLIEIRRG